MKKIITVLLVLIGFKGMSQDSLVQYKTYVSVSSGISSNREPGFSLEVGRWGMSSPISFSWDVDVNYDRSFKNPMVWTGPKLYYTVYQKDKFSYMVYGSPKITFKNLPTDNFIIENGLCLNYNVNDDCILTFTQYFQSSSTYTFHPNLSISLTVLFDKE